MKVWNCGEFVEVNFGQRVSVLRCGSGHSVFGEAATLSHATSQHLVFVTDSGAIVKTRRDGLQTIGKAAKNRYFVSLHQPEEYGKEFYSWPVSFWNEKTCRLEKK